MSTIKISQLDNIETLKNTDILPVVNDGETKKMTVEKLSDIFSSKDYLNTKLKDIPVHYIRLTNVNDTAGLRDAGTITLTSSHFNAFKNIINTYDDYKKPLIYVDLSYDASWGGGYSQQYYCLLYTSEKMGMSSSTGSYTSFFFRGFNIYDFAGGIRTIEFRFNTNYVEGEYTFRDGTITVRNGEYLTLNNTSGYFPTDDFHPATKRYVDDNLVQRVELPVATVLNVGTIYQYIGETTDKYVKGYWYENVETITTNTDGSTKKTYKWYPISTQDSQALPLIEIPILASGSSSLGVPNDWFSDTEVCKDLSDFINSRVGKGIGGLNVIYGNKLQYCSLFQNYNSTDTTGLVTTSTTEYRLNTTIEHYGASSIYWSPTNETFGTRLRTLYIRGEWVDGVYNCTSYTIYSGIASLVGTPYVKNNTLTKNNTTSYTPTGDYNPATKKYVDDAISTAITDALGGEY